MKTISYDFHQKYIYTENSSLVVEELILGEKGYLRKIFNQHYIVAVIIIA